MEQIRVIPAEDAHKDMFVKEFTGCYFDSEETAKDHFDRNCSSERLFLLFTGSALAGFFNYRLRYSHYANYLEDICVSGRFQRKGLSRYLLEKYIEISRGQMTKNSIALSSTNMSNTISQKMHESFGFRTIGVLKGLHYGEDEVFYAFDLDR
jgi:ribosomal protein S18 acetylase RimI-like enzyme